MVDVEFSLGVFTPHDVATVLKSLLSELPEPLLLERHLAAYCQAAAMSDERKRRETVQLLLQLLPRENERLLELLVELLAAVAACRSNLMTAEALGTVLAPCVLVPRRMSAPELQAVTSDVTRVVQYLIESAGDLFSVPRQLELDIYAYWKSQVLYYFVILFKQYNSCDK